MKIKQFNYEEIELLSKNIYVENISSRTILFTDEFKVLFIKESVEGNNPKDIFEKYGFNAEVLGKARIRSSAQR